jgi:hypothetical protein
MTVVENCRKLGANPLKWMRAIVRNVIELLNIHPSA